MRTHTAGLFGDRPARCSPKKFCSIAAAMPLPRVVGVSLLKKSSSICLTIEYSYYRDVHLWVGEDFLQHIL